MHEFPPIELHICSISILLLPSSFVIIVVLNPTATGAHTTPHMASCAAIAAAVGRISGVLPGSFAYRAENLALSKTFRTAFHIFVLPSVFIFSNISVGLDFCRSR